MEWRYVPAYPLTRPPRWASLGPGLNLLRVQMFPIPVPTVEHITIYTIVYQSVQVLTLDAVSAVEPCWPVLITHSISTSFLPPSRHAIVPTFQGALALSLFWIRCTVPCSAGICSPLCCSRSPTHSFHLPNAQPPVAFSATGTSF